MAEHAPLYDWTLQEAAKYNEADRWRANNFENFKCAMAIEDGISANFQSNQLNTDFAQSLVEQFGFNRVNRVLANAIQFRLDDGRFSDANKEWAKGIRVPKEEYRHMYDLASHPGLIDLLTNRVRQLYQDLNLFDAGHCVRDSWKENYKDKVLVLKASVLKDEYKHPEYQLFLASSGFGCSPSASGTKVFGEFLFDGEKTHFARSDFYGPIQDEHLPQWARDKLEELNATTKHAMVQTM